MRLRLPLLLWFSVLMTTVDGAVEFAGYISSPAGVQFVLIDRESRLKSEFLTIGESFQGNRIVAFDREEEVLTIQRSGDDSVARLALRRALVKDSNWSQNGDRLTIFVSAEGTLLHDGKRVDIGSLEKIFQASAVDGWLFLHVKPVKGGDDHAMRKTMLLMMRAFRSSGVLGRIKWDEIR